MAEGAIDSMASKSRQRRRANKRAETEHTKTVKRAGASEIERRLSSRLAQARTALLATFEGATPGDPRLTRLQPALQAEILGLEAQLFAEQAARAQDHATESGAAGLDLEVLDARAASMRKRSRQAHSDGCKWQAEARRASELVLADKVERIEKQLRSRGDFERGLSEL